MSEPREPQANPASSRSEAAPAGSRTSELDQVATRLVSGLYALDKALRVYELNNRAVLGLLDDLAEAIRNAPGGEGRGPAIELQDEHVLLNGSPTRLGYKVWLRARELATSLRRRGIRGLVLPAEPTRQKLQLLFARLQKIRLASAPEAGPLLDQIKLETGASVLSAPPLAPTEHLRERERDRQVVRLYAALTVLVRDALEAARASRRVTLVPLKRVLQALSDELEHREALLLALMDVPGYRGHQETHLANVTLLALAVGRRLGLGPERLMQVALAAAFHDLPRALVPRDVQARLERGEPLSESERGAIEAAPGRAIRFLLQGPGASTPHSLAPVVTLAEAVDEFVRPPSYRSGVGPSAVSRLLAVVNAYELLVRPVGDWDPLLPAEAMRWLLVDHADRFDPDLLQAFGRVLGLFPTGSLVELTTGEIAVVVGQHDEEGCAGAPLVELLTAADGEPMVPERVDLASDHRSIRAPLEPGAFGFDWLQHFLRPAGISL
jgi:HD-GYP domain-containing protein (c-di-GMP phosphodiesterase class II)